MTDPRNELGFDSTRPEQPDKSNSLDLQPQLKTCGQAFLHNIPAELRARPQWVRRDERKRPLNARTGALASVTDPTTWASFEIAAASPFGIGSGFVFTRDDQFFGIDLDVPPDSMPSEAQQKIYSAFKNGSYSEYSPSGRGIHIIGRCDKSKLPTVKGIKRKEASGHAVEVYTQERYFTVTGNAI